MGETQNDLVKHRDIHFVELHPDPNQAETATQLLSEIEGIISAQERSPTHIHVSYEITRVSLEEIEIGLASMGLHLDNRLLYRLMRALYYYTEETERANLGYTRSDTKSTREIFAQHYQRQDHSLRDQRPEHWRKYL